MCWASLGEFSFQDSVGTAPLTHGTQAGVASVTQTATNSEGDDHPWSG